VSLAPLLDAAPQIPLHAFAAMATFALGLVQFAAPKGTLPHRTIGWIWVALMAVVAISSFWIHQLRLVGPFSPIHLLSIFTLLMLPFGVWRAHRHQVDGHRRVMVLTFLGALVIAGLFTLVPDGSCTPWCSVPEAILGRFSRAFSGPFSGPLGSRLPGP
jgi:uncharacterized membrane protein